MASEQDPMLPQDRGAPEIYVSRAPSIYNGCGFTNEAITEEDNDQRLRRNLLAYVKFFIVVIALLFSLGLLLLGQFPGDEKQELKTLEERVDAILSDTPLIGPCTHILLCEFF